MDKSQKDVSVMSSILQRVHKALKHRIAHNEPWALLHTCAVEIEKRDTLITELVGALEDAKKSIEHLPENVLGRTSVDNIHTGEPSFDYPIKDELMSIIQAAITKAKGAE
ncbi:hypothetical protein TH4_18700 [Thalassospira tepidiphila MCCC 1A03514]|uniref:Uncharacterized protein n=2 Tax=Thalassospira tepidiphila TaxID=393657 RepID=A0A853KW52_9PROT|nr:hypothetical protein TH4_18700 [Thalassospira tepidiphila MCCC 1A03514]